ncbi:ankyrin repeat and zinc finger domain-containing protein 1 isoform X2 [Acyrthosiphon pisum]|uniref:VLRF1 domain-containing protein n=1 Tax=Acyrthosiphon pisum TaxID=7029 RepID=A0A8R2D7F6_ACYPI|nr:ankyrin repeat and zinc finger domain-containing protein 1 isoform X2 [Acyrthosiphon pisum]XP_016663850.1 ankyrin repeat and zinc finger domain-containing protein 1 isoform X2 [Acyrthosiphon pisum]|eukprot:XP_008187953.2 PREDICTED: ankyrin repeat and zinc finger domain-containing protein 1 isoform X2 [Acyrthosiphon pisum]
MSTILPSASKTVLIGRPEYQSLLDGVQLISLGLTRKEETEAVEFKNLEIEKNYLLGLHCTTCQIAFELSEEHRAHYKSDWHRYNLKQKIRNRQTIDEPKFFALENKANDSSSSCESDDEINAYNSHFSIDSKLFFENNSGNAFSVYRCLLTNKKDIPSEEIVVDSLKSFSSKPVWFIVMLGGGRFSAAIFKGEEAIVHKTFHSYTVRAKQGGSQSTQDRSKGGCKSAGASLRRYNEASQLKHIQEILSSWLHHIKLCDLIFYRAIGPNNRNILFGGSNPLIDKNDSRLCQIPFGTKKATFAEVQKVCNQLSTVLVYDSKEIINNSIKNYIFKLFKKRKNTKSRTKKIVEKPIKDIQNSNEKNSENIQLSSMSDSSENDNENEIVEFPQSKILCENNDSVVTNDSKNKKRKKRKKKPINTIVKCAEVEEVKKLLLKTIEEKNSEALSKYLLLEDTHSSITKEHLEKSLNETIDESNNTLLHLASTYCLHDHIYLLLQHGSNPINKNKDAKTPYELAPDKSTRKVFRKFMAVFPDKYDYDKSRLPGPLTEELQEELKERKKAKQKRAKERKVVEELKKEEEIEKQKFLQLSDREKCAIAAEKRFMAVQGTFKLLRCFYCGKNIEEKYPFEYMDYKFCSVQCVKNHRQKNIVI